MCGLTGFYDPGKDVTDPTTLLQRMTETLAHRGPDDERIKWDVERRIGLGFRRLSILDLSDTGSQPMESATGRFVIAYNGEVYNCVELRGELQKSGATFRGSSDTEVMLAAFEKWGLKSALERFVGMFSFALVDKQEHRLHLVRDRVGIKPMYYGKIGRVFVFASELKAFHAFPVARFDVDREALSLMLGRSYVPAPYSIYKDFQKLLPGCILTISTDRPTQSEPSFECYWSAENVARQGKAMQFSGSPKAAVAALDGLLRIAVKQRMLSDVPLGAFLSGGIDSSTVVALMQTQSSIPVKTFSIGFREDQYDEADHARQVSQHLGTEHTELYVTSNDALSVIPSLPEFYDEPFADSSQIPTYLVSELARQSVTVSLSGDGGDELFLGYSRYQAAARLWGYFRRWPRPIRVSLAKLITATPTGLLDTTLSGLKSALSRYGMPGNAGDKLKKLARVMTAENRELFYEQFTTSDGGKLVLGASGGLNRYSDLASMQSSPYTDYMMLKDTITYLPDDILVKVDRASMAVSLEARVPILDHRVLEFAWSLPSEYKSRNGAGKWILRELLCKYVPRELVDRPKMGFGVPIESWLRGPLRDWAEDLLNSTRLKNEGYLNVSAVRNLWQEHSKGTRRWHGQLWPILMFQAWLQHQSTGITTKRP